MGAVRSKSDIYSLTQTLRLYEGCQINFNKAFLLLLLLSIELIPVIQIILEEGGNLPGGFTNVSRGRKVANKSVHNSSSI